MGRYRNQIIGKRSNSLPKKQLGALIPVDNERRYESANGAILATSVWPRAEAFILLNITTPEFTYEDQYRDIEAPPLPEGKVHQYALLKYSREKWSLATRTNGGENITLHEAMFDPRPGFMTYEYNEEGKPTRKERVLDLFVDVVSQKWKGARKDGDVRRLTMVIDMDMVIGTPNFLENAGWTVDKQ